MVPGVRERSERIKLWVWVLIAAGSFLRLYRLDYQGLWVDEALQYSVANSENLQRVITVALSNYANPPLSQIITHLFLKAGDSDFLLRLPSALFGIGSLPLFYIFTRRMISPAAAFFSLLVMAVSPFHVWYCQDARMYAQLIFFTLLANLVLLNAVETEKFRWWALYALSITLGLSTQVFMALAIVPHFVWLASFQRRKLPAFGLSILAPALLLLALAPLLLHSLSVSAGGHERAGLSLWPVAYTFFSYAAGFSLGPSLADLHEDLSFRFFLQFLPTILFVVLLYGFLLISGTRALVRKTDLRPAVLVLAGLGIPILGILAYSLFLRFNVRYTAVAFPYFCVLAGTALASQPRKGATTLSLSLVLVTSGWSLHNYFSNPYYAKEDVRSAVQAWRRTAGGQLLFSNAEITVDRYLGEKEAGRHLAIVDTPEGISTVRRFMEEQRLLTAQVLLSRDWGRRLEESVTGAFEVGTQHNYPGAKLIEISLRR